MALNYESIIHKIFPKGEKLKIDWLYGDFRLNGKFLGYDNYDWLHYESYIHLKIEQEKITTLKILSPQELKVYSVEQIKFFRSRENE